ncbi:hypothetical protein SAMN05444276_101109 [Paracoccus sanguinis]|uniref:Uncharacterized protein n=1 Tax=Paracoccus sanguinis TaxID=1545044 RepID=A0A1H2QSH5_9RHOB|nr:hypothetical protein SAMN05444276_101109 [Paracoccus sanguinis]
MTEVAVNEEAVDNPAAKPLRIHAEPKKDRPRRANAAGLGLVLSGASYHGE